MLDIAAVQQALRAEKLDGWLLYDFRGTNILAARVVGVADKKLSRRWFYFIPAEGEPQKLAHAIEPASLDTLPGGKTTYRQWQELEAGVAKLVAGRRHVAMEYSPRNGNPYISRVDAGTIELVRGAGVEVVSSGDLIQLFEATWDDAQIASHHEAAKHTNAAYEVAWQFISDEIRAHGQVSELTVQKRIMDHFQTNGMTTYSPPIVGEGPHSGDPHYEPTLAHNFAIKPGSIVLIDLWAKMDRPRAVYSDLTRMGYVGETVPAKLVELFGIVAAARDAGIRTVTEAFAAGRPLIGATVDDATRKVIADAGYGAYFIHRTGHNIGQEVHGNGAHIDGLETREDRRLLPRTCFSIEPGIYLPEFGVRSEINVLIDATGAVHVTGGQLQTEVVRIRV
ncbi:MAG: M24 family metallopeptidase [Gemmataceae bacterium]